jgi:hypothetical protein
MDDHDWLGWEWDHPRRMMCLGPCTRIIALT